MKKWVSVLAATACIAVVAAGASAATSTSGQAMLDADGKPVPADIAAKLVKLNSNDACNQQQVQFIKDAMKGVGPKKTNLSSCGNAETELVSGDGYVKADPSEIGTQASTITLYSSPKTEFRVLGVLNWRARTGQRFTFENNNGRREIQWFANKPTLACSAVFGWSCTTANASTVWETRPLTIMARGDYSFKKANTGNVNFTHVGTLTWNGDGTWDDGSPLN